VVSTIFGLIVAAIDTTFLWIAGVPLALLWGLLAFGAVLAIPLILLAKALLLDVDSDTRGSPDCSRAGPAPEELVEVPVRRSGRSVGQAKGPGVGEQRPGEAVETAQ
jgi:hypothetical protein